MQKEYYIKCACYVEGINLTLFEDEPSTLYMTFWDDRGYSHHPYSFLKKIKMIWTIITGGKIDGNGVVMNRDEIESLHSILCEVLRNSKGDPEIFD